jgi:hypothetical protein
VFNTEYRIRIDGLRMDIEALAARIKSGEIALDAPRVKSVKELTGLIKSGTNRLKKSRGKIGKEIANIQKARKKAEAKGEDAFSAADMMRLNDKIARRNADTESTVKAIELILIQFDNPAAGNAADGAADGGAINAADGMIRADGMSNTADGMICADGGAATDTVNGIAARPTRADPKGFAPLFGRGQTF